MTEAELIQAAKDAEAIFKAAEAQEQRQQTAWDEARHQRILAHAALEEARIRLLDSLMGVTTG